MKVIAFYLPQFHPIPENDLWWGKGFTEWTNVAKAKKLYPGHYQPKIPADLGFYDLRIQDVKNEQAKLANEAGITGFCYWHYWFGNGKSLLETPFNEVVKLKEPDFPFCLAWANAPWERKKWDKSGNSDILIDQKYGGEEDYINHFNSLLTAFKDKRYIRVDGKLLFCFQRPLHNPDTRNFIKTWRRLAKENGLNDFFFVGEDADSRKKAQIQAEGFDAIYNSDILNIHHEATMVTKISLWFLRKVFRFPSIFKYKNAVKYMVTEDCKNENVIPVIAPNWDHSPRSGGRAMILHNPDPKYFKSAVKKAIQAIKNKPEEKQIFFIKSWNEWGEGNYMEPDLKYGKQYINALREVLDNNNS